MSSAHTPGWSPEWPVGVSAGASGGRHAWPHTGSANCLRRWSLASSPGQAAEALRRDRPGLSGAERQ